MVALRLLSILLTVVLFIYSTALFAKVELTSLQTEITHRLDRVPEFAKIQELANEVGLKEIYLFGGTASAWAHYVYADLEREDGASKLYKEHFDYDYTSIFRSNQDMDIAIDGTPDQAAKLEKKMIELFPHFQGKKTIFEVRLLNSSRGDKDAIIGNPDFLNQNNDSHSTGLIELVGDGKKTIQDVKDMNSKTPKFLKDVYEKKLHFYFDHELHITTKRFKEGKNPEILAVVRYLTKAFQYELSIDAESQKAIEKIVSEFNPSDIAKNDQYVAGWLDRNGPKLFQNAVNMEYAWNTLEKLGLREKLISVNKSIKTKFSLAWWMNKEPLRSKTVGEGSGKTAKELGFDIVAHETNSFEAYESITKAHSGDPNVFISRKGFASESANYGDGFYVQLGKKGAKNTGLTIRFHLDPDARLGVDFERNGSFLIIKNKSALKVIPESLNLSLLEYFTLLSKGKLVFDSSDKAVQEKVRRKIINKLSSVSKEDISTIFSLVKKGIKAKKQNDLLLMEWFTLPVSAEYPEVLASLIDDKRYSQVVISALAQKHWSTHPEFVQQLLDKQDDTLDEKIVEHILSKEFWSNHPEFIDHLVKKGNVDQQLCQYILSESHSGKNLKLVKQLIKKGTVDRYLIQHVLSKAQWVSHPELIEQLLKAGNFDEEIAYFILTEPHWNNHPEWVKKLITKYIKNDGDDVLKLIATDVLSLPHWSSNPELVEMLMKNESMHYYLIRDVFSKPHWSNHPEWIERMLNTGLNDIQIAHSILSKEVWKDYPQWMARIIKNGESNSAIIQYALSQKHWINHPEFVEHFILHGNSEELADLKKYVLSTSHWQESPYIKNLIGDNKLTVKNLREAIKKREGSKKLQITPSSSCNISVATFL